MYVTFAALLADLDFWTDSMSTTMGLDEILGNHKLQKQDLIGKCPRKIRNKIALNSGLMTLPTYINYSES